MSAASITEPRCRPAPGMATGVLPKPVRPGVPIHERVLSMKGAARAEPVSSCRTWIQAR
jgi:hypothetical protein